MMKYRLTITGLVLLFLTAQPVFAEMTHFYLDNKFSNWRLITDDVMGGLSRGAAKPVKTGNKECIALTGSVSTDNNGGFIQIAYDIDRSQAQTIKQHDGIELEIRGNGESYNLHLRTTDLWFPWQAFRASFPTYGDWQKIRLPFDTFTAYKTSETLNTGKLKRIGIVAIGREFNADICVAGIGFYSE